MTHSTELAATEYGKLGLEFAHALADSRYEAAHELLTRDLRAQWPATRLKERFERMIAENKVTAIEALEGFDQYPDKPASDLGGVYVNLRLEDRDDPFFVENEAVMVFVCLEDGHARIRGIKWGRP